MQLSNRIRPRDLEDFFKGCGSVRDVRLITDPRTKRSKGIAYIEFREVESVDKAIALTGQRLLGVPIICKLTQAEKNRMPLIIPSTGTAVIPVTGSMKLYVGSLHVNISEEMLKGIFEPFGNIDAIVLSKDDFGRSKGYGHIQFSNADDAKKAMEQLNNFELANRPIKVAPFIEKPTDMGQVANLDNEELDKTGVNLGPSGKLALMAKLAMGTDIKIPQQTIDAIAAQAHSDAAAENAPQATQCIVLSNMFDLEE
jgi:RNA-binding protein 39